LISSLADRFFKSFFRVSTKVRTRLSCKTRFWRSPKLVIHCRLTPFLAAAQIYREGRRHGFTIRSTTDCLIAAIAIEYGATIWHNDRDYDMIARYTPQRVINAIG